MSRERARRSSGHATSVYVRRALIGWHQLALLAVAGALALLTWAGAVFVLLAEQIFVFVVLPRLGLFRRFVDAEIAEHAKHEATRARAKLLNRMSDEHRLELVRLEGFVDRIHARVATGDTPRTEPADWLGLGGLLAAYVRLAITHRTTLEQFSPEERAHLYGRIARLEVMRAGTNERTRPWVERQLAVVRRRAQAWDGARMQQELMEHELATMGDIVRWMDEQCIVAETVRIRSELEDAVAAWEENSAAMGELASLCTHEETVDAAVLALGRDARESAAGSVGIAFAGARFDARDLAVTERLEPGEVGQPLGSGPATIHLG